VNSDHFSGVKVLARPPLFRATSLRRYFCFPPGLNRVRKNVEKQVNEERRPFSGAEDLSYFEAFTARLKSCPDTRLECEPVFQQPVKPPLLRADSVRAKARTLHNCSIPEAVETVLLFFCGRRTALSQGLKPIMSTAVCGTTEVMPCYKPHNWFRHERIHDLLEGLATLCGMTEVMPCYKPRNWFRHERIHDLLEGLATLYGMP
jgi:hypothetical protein